MPGLRAATIEMLPLDPMGREESRVWLAFVAEAAVEPELVDAAEDAARRLQEPLVARFAAAARSGELRRDLDPEHEATRLRVLRDGLDLHLLTTPRRASRAWALRLLDEHFEALKPVRRSR